MKKSINLHFVHSYGLLVILYALNISCNSILFAQRYSTTFGLISELKASKNSIGIMSADFNSDGIMDLATYGDTQVRFYFQSADGYSFQPATLFVKRPILSGQVAKLNRDSYTDIILVVDNPASIYVYLGKPEEKYYLAFERELNEPFENMLVADINNDKKADLIFYGKHKLGASVYLGNGNGSFQSGTIILPEYSFNSFIVSPLHGNGINDIIASNWITNDVMIFSGFGRMKFSEPAVLHCNGEIGTMATLLLNADFIPDLVVGMADADKCCTFVGDGFGGFKYSGELILGYPQDDICSEDVNSDGKDDLLILSKINKSMNVLLNDGKGNLAEKIPFYAGRSPIMFSILTNPGSANVDVAILDTANTRVRIIHNSDKHNVNSQEKLYATGLSPSGIISEDINHDNWYDIIVANKGSSNLSLFLNQGNGTFAGQIPFDLEDSPQYLRYFNRKDSTAIVLATNTHSDKIAVIEINPRTLSNLSYTLPTLGHPEILDVRLNSVTNNLQIYALEKDNTSQKWTIIKFDKISSVRFTEEYFNLTASNTSLISAAIDKRNNNSIDRIAFAAYNKRQKKEQVYLSQISFNERPLNPRLIYSLSAEESIPAIIWLHDLNNDDIKDLILYFGEPENSISFSLSQNESTYTTVRYNVRQPIQILSADRLQILDIDDDKIPDIIFENNFRKTIELCYGRGDGTFSQPLRLASTGNIGGFVLSDINNDSFAELIVTEPMNGILKIIQLNY